MKDKFTKGPWVINDGVESKFMRGKITTINTLVVICDEPSQYFGAEVANANANLIACAPEMYEEIKRDIECLTRWIDNHGDAFPMTAAWKDMRASKIELLKRARGE